MAYPGSTIPFRRQSENGSHERIVDAPEPNADPNPTPTRPARPAGSAKPRRTAMATGMGGFNIEAPSPRQPPRQYEVREEAPSRFHFHGPARIPTPLLQRKRSVATVWIGRSSFTIGVLAIAGLTLYALVDEVRDLVNEIPNPISPLYEGIHVKPLTPPARLTIEGQKGFMNEPLPLGLSLSGGTGTETVTVTGLVDGTKLSRGTSLGPAGWLVSARDLEETFVSAPNEFLGAMNVTVKLRSGGKLLESRVLQLEWTEKKQANLAATPAPMPLDPTPAPPQRDAEEVAALMSTGQNMLRHGDVVAARLVLNRAANAGNAQAALALGMSFDPAFLSQLGAVGPEADVAQAVKWYEQAAKLGVVEASRHLKRLVSAPN